MAKADFRIKTELETASFTVEPLDQQERILRPSFWQSSLTEQLPILNYLRDFNPVDPNSDTRNYACS